MQEVKEVLYHPEVAQGHGSVSNDVRQMRISLSEEAGGLGEGAKGFVEAFAVSGGVEPSTPSPTPSSSSPPSLAPFFFLILIV
jgi:hypothetical protein